MTRQMVVRVDDEIREKFQRVSRMEVKTASEKIRELMENYIHKADLSRVVDDIWERIGAKARAKGADIKDVDRIIRESRASK